MQIHEFAGLRLVGGTALALQLGHRKSIDIDLFGSLNFEELNPIVVFDKFMSVVSLKRSKNINILAIDGVKVDFVNYAYPWLQPIRSIDNIRLAAIEDIAAMKLAAIAGRGSKKDFIDIYFLLQAYTLEELLKFYSLKYSDGSTMLVLKSLTYFDDAEKDPEIEVFKNFNWHDARHFIIKKVQLYLKTI